MSLGPGAEEEIIEGDIIVPKAITTFTVTTTGRRWPNGLVPYTINKGDENSKLSNAIDAAAAELEKLTCGG